jgi:isocitrate dehydrogenase (NAD+)
MLSRKVCSAAMRAASTKTVTMIPGDGVGPELMNSVKTVFKAADVPINFEEVNLSEVQSMDDETHFQNAVDSIQRNKVCLMGHITAGQTEGVQQTTSFKLRTTLDVYANVCRIKSLEGIKTRHTNLDFYIIREQTEGEYKALEHQPIPGVVEALKIITREKSQRIAKFAFDFALANGRKKVTCVHKANIMKKADGMFLRTFREVAKDYPMIEANDLIVDNTCMQMVSHPHQFDVMVMPNLYGNIIDNLASGLVGGAGVVPGDAYSTNYALFEAGARHPYAQAVGKNIANPTAMLLTSANMLDHMSLESHGTRIRNAVIKTVKSNTLTRDIIEQAACLDERKRTRDMGGYSSTAEFTQAVTRNLERYSAKLA